MTGRFDHAASLLPNGKVLVAGGLDGANLTSAELYDPATGAWAVTGSLNTGRHRHTATLLPTSEVLVAVGETNSGAASASAELGARRRRSGTSGTAFPREASLVQISKF